MNLEDINPRGAGDRQPLKPTDTVVRLSTCPDCDGRGYFLINPFGQLGNASNRTQCSTCLAAHAFFEKTGKLPNGIAWPEANHA